MNDTAFYCVADERYFLGAVALVNSLRLQGHAETVHLLDLGLRAEQRMILEPYVELERAPHGALPWLSKTILPCRHPSEVMVLIDTDMIVTRPLDPLIESAREGRVVAAENDRPRYVEAWGPLLDLGPTRPGPYVSSALVVLGGGAGAEALRLLDDRQRRVDAARTFQGKLADREYEFLYPEQDVLNAVLRTRIEPGLLEVVDRRLAPYPPFEGLRIVDLERLRCAYHDGVEPYLLHHFGRKPWLDPVYHGLYSRLLHRVLAGSDVAVQVPEAEIPLRLRAGARARLARLRVDVADVWRRRILGREGARA